MQGERAADRRIYRLSGADREQFLQGIVSNDLGRLDQGLVYAALLTPQGKYLADFFLLRQGEALLLDAPAALAEGLVRRLGLYRLRADVTIEPASLEVTRGLGTPPEGAFADPRHPALGWRAYGPAATDRAAASPARPIDWDAIRVAHCIPEAGIELLPDETFPLEAGFERLNGVDFRKGCYVGQEVTARMKHKTVLRKGLVTVEVDGAAPPGTEIRQGERTAGVLFTQSGGHGIAQLRFDRAEGPLVAGTARVKAPGGLSGAAE